MKKSIKRRKRKPLTPEQIDRLIGRLRIGELNKLFAYRYGGDRITYEFPDDDAGREDLVILLQHYGFTNPHKMAGIIKLRAPWMEVDEVVRTLEQVNTYCRRWRAETLGRELRVTKGEWQRLGLRTIAPCDMTREERKQERKMRDRLRKGLKRRTQGRKPRADYLAASKSRTKPWETAGISRRTWYRQQAKLNGTGVSPIITLLKQRTDLCHRASRCAEKRLAERVLAFWPERGYQIRASLELEVMHQRMLMQMPATPGLCLPKVPSHQHTHRLGTMQALRSNLKSRGSQFRV